MGLIGRTVERSRIDRLLAAARLGTSGVLVLDGEPGIGKTTLLDQARARTAEMALLRARGVQQEADVPFGGLLSCCGPARPARRAPRPAGAGAADRAGPRAASADRFAIGAATLSLLAAPPSARRCSWSSTTPTGWTRPRWPRCRSPPGGCSPTRSPCSSPRAPASPADAARFRADARRPGPRRLDGAAGAPRRPHAAARRRRRALRAHAGNPLALVELAGAPSTSRPSRPAADRDERRARLRPAHRGAARAGAARARASPPPRPPATWRRSSAPRPPTLGLDLRALDARAERAGLIDHRARHLALVHPLARSAAYRAAAPAERRAPHARWPPCPRDRPTGAPGTSPRPRPAPTRTPRRRSTPPAGAPAHAAPTPRRRRRRARRAAQRRRRRARPPPARRRRRRWLAGQGERADRLRAGARARARPARCGPSSTTSAATPRCAPAACMEAHDPLRAAAAIDPGPGAVAMLAEAADACVYAARPARDARRRARRAFARAARTPPTATLPRQPRARHGLIYNGRGEEGADARARGDRDPRGTPTCCTTTRASLASAALGPLWLRDAREARAPDRPRDRRRPRRGRPRRAAVLALARRARRRHQRPARPSPARSTRRRSASRARPARRPRCAAALAGLACVDARQGARPPRASTPRRRWR